MGEAIWTTVKFRIPSGWGDKNPLVDSLGDALINGESNFDDGQWTIYGEGNYGLNDDEVEFWLDWMRDHKVPFIASDEPKYEFEGTTIVFDGEREWSGTSSAEQATLTKTEYESIKASTSEFRTVEEFFSILNTKSCADFPIDHLPAEFPNRGGVMKKVPCPGVFLVPDADGSQRTVVHFEWENISFQMFDDEALRLAREIHDILEIAPGDEEEEHPAW